MSSSSAQAHARALVRQARAAVESGGGGGATNNAPTSIRGVSLCTQIPGVSDAVICVLCKKRVKTGKMWFIHSRTPQHQHLLQRLELALVSRESQPAAAAEHAEPSSQENKDEAEKTEDKPSAAAADGGGLLGAAYSDDEESSSDGESETKEKEEPKRGNDVVVPPLRKPSKTEPIGPIPSNEDLLDSDDIRNYVTAELAGLVVSGTEYEYDVEDDGQGKKRRRRPPPPAAKKKVLATSALPAGFFDDEDKAAEVFGKEAPSKRKAKEIQNDMRKLELELDAGDRRRLVEGNVRYEEDSEVITDEYVRSLHHDQEERERHLDDIRDKRRRVHERHELHLPPPAEESSAIDTESSSDVDIASPESPRRDTESTGPAKAVTVEDEEDEEEDFDEDDFAVNWRSKSM
ncbi:hypothetical protein FOL47_008229 [Perkinsus chesapeaki]|uniref:Coiled-coil domain-containing protein 16 n=1 Tax=Perkinsus chesapeaki TaxID=330153 RepID=A0A7J6LFC5_PERCH|nr:hypothetical protein FOL47_008229 [Perkinsus chesapeaki]